MTTPPAVLNRLRCHSPEHAAGLLPDLFRAGYHDVEIVGDVLVFYASPKGAQEVADWAWRNGAAPSAEPLVETSVLGDLLERARGLIRSAR